jgi:hypothetical protein
MGFQFNHVGGGTKVDRLYKLKIQSRPIALVEGAWFQPLNL